MAELYGAANQDSGVSSYISAASPAPSTGFGHSLGVSGWSWRTPKVGGKGLVCLGQREARNECRQEGGQESSFIQWAFTDCPLRAGHWDVVQIRLTISAPMEADSSMGGGTNFNEGTAYMALCRSPAHRGEPFSGSALGVTRAGPGKDLSLTSGVLREKRGPGFLCFLSPHPGT